MIYPELFWFWIQIWWDRDAAEGLSILSHVLWKWRDVMPDPFSHHNDADVKPRTDQIPGLWSDEKGRSGSKWTNVPIVCEDQDENQDVTTEPLTKMTI